ncbi:MAG: AAA family ATPase, partial [Desulfomonile sp.]|nr:AAA family ATPase [Desulfomonile sp.]
MSLDVLRLTNFTAFSELKIEFSPGLNVIVGENATGKSHILKLGYALAHVLHELGRFEEERVGQIAAGSSKSWLQRRIAEKLVGVFKPDTLGRLCRRGVGRARTEVAAGFGMNDELRFSFSSNSKSEVALPGRPKNALDEAPIFFPPKEMMSLSPGFMSLYEQRELALDETYYDLCKLLNFPLLKGKRADRIAEIVDPLAEIMGGSVRENSG